MVVRVARRVTLDASAEERQQDPADVSRLDIRDEGDARALLGSLEAVRVMDVGSGITRLDRVPVRRFEDNVLLEGHGRGPRGPVPKPHFVPVPPQDLAVARRGRVTAPMVVLPEVGPPRIYGVPREGDRALHADEHLTAAGAAAEAVGAPGPGFLFFGGAGF